MQFDLQHAVQIIERISSVVDSLLRGLDDEWIYKNEGGDTWSAYDIVGHFIEGEDTDWIPRMNIILSDSSDKTFEPFDRFAQFEKSKGKSLDQLLDEFKIKRKKSLDALLNANLQSHDLQLKGIHPAFGEVTLEQLLAAWVVHDLAHVNQISRVLAKQYTDAVGPWKAYMNILNR
jgi:hypothetical protein